MNKIIYLMWDFFSRIDIILAVLGFLFGILGFLGATFNIVQQGKKRKTVVIALFAIISTALGFFSFYFRGMQPVPDINHISYESAYQILENKNIKYIIINENEYYGIALRDTIVTLNNVHSREIIHNDFVVELRIVGMVSKPDDNEIPIETSSEASTKKSTDVEGPFTDAFISLR